MLRDATQNSCAVWKTKMLCSVDVYNETIASRVVRRDGVSVYPKAVVRCHLCSISSRLQYHLSTSLSSTQFWCLSLQLGVTLLGGRRHGENYSHCL